MKPAVLTPATFVARPNRFIVRAALPGGDETDAHLADPGRLVELLTPGATLRLRRAPPDGKRRTDYSVVLVRAPSPSRAWVSLETGRANRLAETLLASGKIRGLGTDWKPRREVPCGNSRFDFLLERRSERCWVEVKSVTLVESGTALFPDAPTARGTRHVRELTARVRRGERACVLFVVQRSDARRVRPHRSIDPALAGALDDARTAGVMLRAARFALSRDADARHLGAVPVVL